MLLAERSLEAAIEYQDDVFLPGKVGKGYRLTLEIIQGEIGCGGVN